MASEQTVEEQEQNITEKKGRATPGRRGRRKVKGGKPVEEQGNAITRPFFAVFDYFNNVRAEMNKVSWPNREDTRRLTILCINVTIASALFLGGLSVILTQYMELGLTPGNAWLLILAILVMVAGAAYAMRRGSL